MPKYEVTWKEKRVVNCYAEVEAENEEQAKKLAQDYEFNVEEGDDYTDEILPAKVKEIK